MRNLALALVMVVMVLVLLAPMVPLLTQTQAVRLRVVESSLVANMPAGLVAITRAGAIAGYYCLRGMPGSGWSIMLNAYLNNGLIIQDIIGSMTPTPLPILANYATNIWLIGNTGAHLIHARLIPIAFTCGWLVIRILNGTAFIGFSIDGRHAIWFDNYNTGNGSIIIASIVMGGDGDGRTAIARNGLMVDLALYYWNGSTWLPAIVESVTDSEVLEAVNHVWASVSVNCSVVLSWREPVPYTECPTPPGFEG
jgi:hypothetical protein